MEQQDEDDRPVDEGNWQHPSGVLEAQLQAAKERADRLRGTAKGESMLDKQIIDARVSGLSVPEIAERFELDDEQVAIRLKRWYDRIEITDVQELRTLQIARLEKVIAAMTVWMEQGSVDHAKIVLDAIERTNKMMSLEVETTRLEVQIVSEAQADLMIHMAQAIVMVLLNAPDVQAVLGSARINQVVGDALMAASRVVVDGQSQVFDTKQIEIEAALPVPPKNRG